MNIVACIVTVAPLRKEASHRSEMVSELLFGEFAQLLEEAKDFNRVKCLYDGYEGWCQRSQLTDTGMSAVPDMTKKFISVKHDQMQTGEQSWPVTFATPVQSDGKNFHVGKYSMSYRSGNIWDAATAVFEKNKILFCTHQYLHTPYLWGGKSVLGIDCSGFVQQVFKLFDIFLPRDAYQQVEYGDVVCFLQEAQCGDLAYFDNAEGRITHVGILIDNETIIHSSGKVRIDKIDSAGIISSDTGERTHQLRIIKRYTVKGAVS